MQKVERGVAQWNVGLADKLHADLAFRASVLGRERDKVNKPDKSTNQSVGSQIKIILLQGGSG